MKMAIELCSENCGVGVSSMSPRISFSQDFSQSDFIPVEQHPFGSNPPSGLESSTDFDFRVTESFELESFPADEFFSDGRIIPTTEAKRKSKNIAPLMQKGHHHQLAQAQSHPPLPPPCVVNNHYNASSSSSSTSRSCLKRGGGNKCLNNDEVYEKQSSKSFWSFKRSSSCGNGYRRSLCPLPLLSRSNSTGSTTPPSVRRNSLSKEGHNKQNSQKHSSSSTTRSSYSSYSPSFVPNNYQKPPLNYKSHGSYGNNSVRVSPVLNVHSANLFGLASIFSNNRDKSKKK